MPNRRGPPNAEAFGYDDRRLKQHPLALGVAAVTLLVGGVWITQHGGRWSEIGGTVMALPSGLALVAMLGEGRRRERLGAVLAPLGLISYGIYLWHAVARDAITAHAPHLLPGAGSGPHAWPVEVVFLALVTIPLALASWLLIERPLLRWTTNWDRSSQTAAAMRKPSMARKQG